LTKPDPNQYDLGNAFRAQGKWDDAIACYRKALAIAPEHADTYHKLGDVLHRQGRLSEAVASYRNALSIQPDAANLHYNLGGVLRDQGKASEAIASYRKAISIEPGHVMARNNLGNVQKAEGDLDGAAATYRETLVIKPDAMEAHFNLGVVLELQGKQDEAIDRYQEALALKPDSVPVLYTLGNTFSNQGRLDDAVASYRSALAIRPDLADIHNNLGNALQAQGKTDEAIACYRRALALKPDDAGAYNNLGNVLSEVGRVDAAAASYRRALELMETPQLKANFALCIKRMDAVDVDAQLRRLVIRAIAEPWARPSDLAHACVRLICADRDIRDCVERASRAWPARLAGPELFGPTGLATLSNESLLQHLLEGAPVCDIALERFLTMARQALLDAAARTAAGDDSEGNVPNFYCALARQCFVNEFVFSCTEEERGQVAHLREKLQAALRAGDPVPTLWIVAVAAYSPLLSLPAVATLLRRSWPQSVMALLKQQIAEPLEEQRLRDALRRITTVDDAMSGLVRQQYEENPYPRWIRLPPASQAHSLQSYLRQHFPFAHFHHARGEGDIDILIAGCGTGQEPIETAQQFPRAHVLAVDLSLASLGYAKRKTEESGVANIEYAQGDILQLGSIGRTFDMIASVGVLHHLPNPTAGLRVLLSLLRPGGFMHLGLYSERARRDVVAARAFIAEYEYSADASGIRRCRQDLVERSPQFERLTSSRDFYATSECRDLLFHVQEHRFTLPEIKQLLPDLGLHLIGFLLEPQVIHGYRERFPDDKSMTNLDHWNAYEDEFPDTFVGMYKFWVQTAPA
jgi:tetratricopeptide (TPR) repeat protein/SAM-dependent methyltransferase